MKVDVLFWFYKDFATCRERIQSIRMLNDGVAVFALYGGPLAEAETARSAVRDLVDDFYVYPHAKDPLWKWRHGDRVLSAWYSERGRHLTWETIFVMQWDMLILDPLEKLFAGLQPQEILLSGFRPFHTVSPWWSWSDPDDADVGSLRRLLREKHNYDGELFVCLFIVACLPRLFLEKYVASGCGEVGFLEYNIPTMAHVFGIPVCQHHPFEPWWADDPATRHVGWQGKTLNAVGHEIPRSAILAELADRHGKRLFHPVSRTFPRWLTERHVANVALTFYPVLRMLLRNAKRLRLSVRNRVRRGA